MNFKKHLNKRGEKIYDLMMELINIQSVSNTKGVAEIGDYIYDNMKEWSYFKKNPDHLKKIMLADDNLNRNNIVALIRGHKRQTNKTVVYISHMDTVDIGEYGSLKDIACRPIKLMEKLKERDLKESVRMDLRSGEWLFGRGSADMKSGVAVEIQLLKEFIDKIDKFSGNILLVITVNEEADSQGMLSVAQPIRELAEKYNLDLIGGINTDYTTAEPFAEKDDRYIYQGSLGKIVPAVFVIGRGSHIGEVFAGYDVNLWLSKLTDRIENNMDFADKIKGMITNPPVSLKQTDLKEEYNGQLPYKGFAYYNFLNYKRGSAEIIDLFKSEVEKSFDKSIKKINNEYKKYCQASAKKFNKIQYESKIFTYGELFKLIMKRIKPAVIEKELFKVLNKCKEENIMDIRIQSLKMVEKLWDMSKLSGPAAVVFLVPPFYPPNNPYVNDPKFSKFSEVIYKFVNSEIQPEINYNLTIEPFFPYLSDASFTTYQEQKRDEEALTENMPFWDKGWKIDIENVKKLNIPIADVGVYGKGAHKFLERVHLPYTLNTLPEIIKKLTIRLLK